MRTVIAVALVIASGASAAGAESIPGRQLGPPRLDMLKDAQICPDGRGSYFLTGTAATFDKSGGVDFDHNRGVPLWRSRDLKTWENLGFAWDRGEHFARSSGRPKLGVWLDWSAPADRIDGLLAQATTTPELCHIGDAWYIVCAMNGQNIILQKSTSGKPEGPYDDYAYLATRGGDPSLFADDDGKVYLVFADAWIARVKPDLTALAEEPRLLLPAPNPDRLTLGDPGVALFKRGGQYCVLAARWQVCDGRPSHDAVLWTADAVYGPYHEMNVVLRGSGTVSVFIDGSGKWHAVSSRPGELWIVEVPQP
jgi:beta-xylosidase